MKKLINLGLVLALASFMVSCGGKSEPQDVAKKFMKALLDQDFDKAKKYSSKSTVAMLQMMESMMKMGGEEGLKMPGMEAGFDAIKWGETKVDGDTAVCWYTVGGEESTKEKIDLIKEDGSWKVVMKKE